jgi:guanine deaminase
MKDMFKIIRGEIFDFIAESALDASQPVPRFFSDGALLVSAGKVEEIGYYKNIREKYPDVPCEQYIGKLIVPAFIDTHIHYPQMEIIGSFGFQLVDWLNHYAFPAEKSFKDPVYAKAVAELFIQELFKNGTASCMAFSTVHKKAVDALFEVASRYNMRMITGRVWMNRHGDAALMDDTKNAYSETRELIKRWHKKGRNLYAITPRFAISCDEASLELQGKLHSEFPDTYVQTHLSENDQEVQMIRTLFPEAGDYLEVYEKAGLVTSRAIFAHGIHLSDSELERLAKTGASIAHCPTSNLFLGSGLFGLKRTHEAGVQISIATDVGGGTSFSLLKTLGEAYKVQQLQKYALKPLEAFYRITLGAARALHLDHLMGNFDPGKEADFVVLDCAVTTPQKLRMEFLNRTQILDVESLLFGLQITGDDRNVVATYVMGEKVYENPNQECCETPNIYSNIP